MNVILKKVILKRSLGGTFKITLIRWTSILGWGELNPFSPLLLFLNNGLGILNPLLVLNFNKIHKANSNSKFDETNAIGFLNQFDV